MYGEGTVLQQTELQQQFQRRPVRPTLVPAFAFGAIALRYLPWFCVHVELRRNHSKSRTNSTQGVGLSPSKSFIGSYCLHLPNILFEIFARSDLLVSLAFDTGLVQGVY